MYEKVQLFGTHPHNSDYVGAALILAAVAGSIMEHFILNKIGHKCFVM